MNSEISPKKILIVDDQPENIHILTENLESAYDIFYATTGEKALDIVFSNNRPDLILLDIMMPGIDGYETCRRLKDMESTSDIPVIFMTALVETIHKIRGFEAGAVDYVTKPFQREEVAARVGAHLHLLELTTELRNANELLEKRVEERTKELTEQNMHLQNEILKRKKAEEKLEQRVMERTLELQQSHAQLLHSEKLAAVGNLSASLAHEFNNPLQSVMTIIKGIGQYVPMEKKEAELVTLALQECNRMKNLIADLTDFFRPTSGKLAWVDLHTILCALLLISKEDFFSRRIKIVKKFADNMPPIMAVADQMKQVFLNLFNNAAEACEGGGVITITTEAIEGEKVAVHIEDNGVGIHSENIARIFEPFFTTKPDLKGTGLGLSVSYGIVKKHGGRIDVKNEYGKGSKFSVFLPIESVN